MPASVWPRAERAPGAMSMHHRRMVSPISKSMNSIPTEGGPEGCPRFPPGKLEYYRNRFGRIGHVRSCAGGSEPAHIVDVKQLEETFCQGKSGIEIQTSAMSVLYQPRNTSWYELEKD